MANTFTNASALLTGSLATVYSAGGSTRAVIHSVIIANIHASNAVTVDITLTQNSARPSGSATVTYLIKGVDLPNKSTLIFDKPVNLAPSDAIQAVCSATSSAHITLSILEIT